MRESTGSELWSLDWEALGGRGTRVSESSPYIRNVTAFQGTVFVMYRSADEAWHMHVERAMMHLRRAYASQG